MATYSKSFAVLPKQAFPAADAGMVEFWHQLQPHAHEFKYQGKNGMFGKCDSAVLHAFVRHVKPSRVIEVGSGYSTRVVHAALRMNAADTGQKAVHTCVEPYRAAVLQGLDVEVIQKPVQEVDLAIFDQLQTGDLLFLDNSHVIRYATG